MYGYNGRFLFINLKTRTWHVEEPGEQYFKDYLGGYCLAAPILYERIKPGCDPLGPENILAFTSGLYNGTKAHLGGRFMVAAKSPATGGWGDANCGGRFATYLKATGYDAIFFEDVADTPVYVSVYNDDIQFHNASHLWGVDAKEAELLIHEEMGRNYQVALIGQAGENLSCIAGIFNDQGRAAARMGIGAVMGSKRLKALCCGGTAKPLVAHEERLQEQVKDMIEDAKRHLNTHPYVETGTSAVYHFFANLNDTPIKNWRSSFKAENYTMDEVANLSGEAYHPFRRKKYACTQCPCACGAILDVPDSNGGTYETHRPEYETIGAFGSVCMNKDIYHILAANDACNRYGLDTISAGTTIAWAMECNEHGLFTEEELEGMDLSWGNGAIFVELLRKMTYREGFLGALLADGSKKAAEKLGRGSEAFRTDAGGIELPMHDPRCWPGFCMSYSVDGGPGRHTAGGLGFFEHAFGDVELLERFPEMRGLDARRFDYEEDKGEIQKNINNWMQFLFAMGLCQLSKLSYYKHYNSLETYRSITGWDDVTIDDILERGERIHTIRHMFNIREGLRPHVEFRLQDRTVGVPPLESGPTAGITCPTEKYFSDYYRAMDYNPETAMPSDAVFERLGIKELIYNHLH